MFPHPSAGQLSQLCPLVRRAKQFAEVTVTYLPIPPEELRICSNCDASFANADKERTQGGELRAFVSRELLEGALAEWVPAHWKSFKLPRVAPSTLAGDKHKEQQRPSGPKTG